MKLTDVSIQHRTTVFVLMLLIAFFGVFAYLTLPREAAPDIQIPYIIVTTTYPGVAPTDIESSITKEIEKRLKTISDVDKIYSISREGTSSITVKFLPGLDIDRALQKVRDQVNEAKPDMPDDIDEPSIKEINVSEFPIMLLNIHGPCGLLKLKDMAEDLQDEIEKIDGVLEARISGAPTRQIRVEADPFRLAAYQIPVMSLFATIAAENQNISGGTLDMAEAKYNVRVEGEFSQPSEIYDLIVTERQGRPIYLSDLAGVIDTFEDRTSISRFNGQESVTVAVVKRAGKNVIQIADQVRLLVADYLQKTPSGTQIDITLDASKQIRDMVHDLENNMITGLVLVVAVLFVLGLRNSIMVATAIPFSMLITFAVLQALGITLNMIVLFGLILVAGMLVDNAIVIVENIYRHMQEGKPRMRAAREATAEVAWPVTTSTLTTVVAFVPLLWWPGVMGEFLSYLPKTLIIALLASLGVALVINPTLSSLFVKPKSLRQVTVMEGLPEHWFIQGYARLLGFCLRPVARALVVLLFVVGLVASGALFFLCNGRMELFPSSDPRRAQINVTMPVGTRLETTDAVVRDIEKVVRRYQADSGGDPASPGRSPATPGRSPARNIKHVTADVGAETTSVGSFLSGGGQGDSFRAQISAEFLDFNDRQAPALETVDRLRRELAGRPGAQIKVDVEKHGPPVGKPVAIEISGDDYDRLIALSEQVQAIVRQIPGVTDIDDDYDPGKPELRVIVDRQRAALLGLSTAYVARTIKGAVNGLKVGKYREGDDDYDIVVRLPESFRQKVEDLEALTIAAADGTPVPLSAVARIEYTSGLAAIRRIDQKRTITVSSEVVQGANSNRILHEATLQLDGLVRGLPSGYSLNFTGEQEEQNKAAAFLLKAGIAAILLIFLILVTEFTSVLLPLIIMLSVVMSWMGVFLGLTLWNMPFGIIMTGIGVISLAGVVVNNAIVLIAYMEQLRERGLGLMDAVVRASAIRLRPVLLTAITAILGLAPVVLGVNVDLRQLQFNLRSESAQWWGPMAVVVVVGLAVATALTLILVPVVYVTMDRGRQAWRRLFAGQPVAQ